MPPYMKSVLSALNNKSIHCSFCSEILLDHIGSLAMKHSHSQLLKMYDSEEYFLFNALNKLHAIIMQKHLILLKSIIKDLCQEKSIGL
jgi:hypothetical protein